jgi:hypothetical protein
VGRQRLTAWAMATPLTDISRTAWQQSSILYTRWWPVRPEHALSYNERRRRRPSVTTLHRDGEEWATS